MKKFLAILLAATMIVGAFTFSVSAAEANVGKNQVVGSQGVKNSIDDGVASFDPTDSVGTVYLDIKTKAHRYAVDVVFDKLVFEYDSEYVWNVNTYDYEGVASGKEPTIETTVTVTNHSDMPIALTITPVVESALVDLISIAATHANVEGDNVNGSVQGSQIYTSKLFEVRNQTPTIDSAKFTYTVNDWSDLFNTLEVDANGRAKIGTITVTVSMDTSATPSN